jgi:hypothetical protein
VRAIRLTKAEVAVLRGIDGDLRGAGITRDADVKAWQSLMAKVRAAQEERPAGADVGPIQAALVSAARGKVVELVAGYPVASRRCQQLGVTPDDARQVGEWMARQQWLRGPQTLLDVLNKWPQWLSKARATAAPPTLKAGLDAGGGNRADSGQGANGTGEGAAQGRPARGFR